MNPQGNPPPNNEGGPDRRGRSRGLSGLFAGDSHRYQGPQHDVLQTPFQGQQGRTRFLSSAFHEHKLDERGESSGQVPRASLATPVVPNRLESHLETERAFGAGVAYARDSAREYAHDYAREPYQTPGYGGHGSYGGPPNSAYPSSTRANAVAAILDVTNFMKANGFHDDPRLAHVKLPVRARTDIPSMTDMKLMFDWMYLRIDPEFQRTGMKKELESRTMMSNLHYPHVNEVRRAFASNSTSPTDWQNVVQAMLFMKRTIDWLSETGPRMLSSLREDDFISMWQEEHLLEVYASQLSGDKTALERFENRQDRDISHYVDELQASLKSVEELTEQENQALQALQAEEQARAKADAKREAIDHDLEKLADHHARMPAKVEKMRLEKAEKDKALATAIQEHNALKNDRLEIEAVARRQGLTLDELSRFSQTQAVLSSELRTVEDIVSKKNHEVLTLEKQHGDVLAAVRKAAQEFNGLIEPFDLKTDIKVPGELDGAPGDFLTENETRAIRSKLRSRNVEISEKVSKLQIDKKEVEYQLEDVLESQQSLEAKRSRLVAQATEAQALLESTREDHVRLGQQLESQKERVMESNSNLLDEARQRNRRARTNVEEAKKEHEALLAVVQREIDPRSAQVERQYGEFYEVYESLGVNLKSAAYNAESLMQEIGELGEAISAVEPAEDLDLAVEDNVEIRANQRAKELLGIYNQELARRAAV